MPVSADDHRVIEAVVSAARLALSGPVAPVSEAEATRILFALMPLVERGIPSPLLEHDEVIQQAKSLFLRLRNEISRRPDDEARAPAYVHARRR